MAEGVTTLEVKSGYGLTVEHECTQLQVARTLAQERTVDVVTTFLGAHALPPEAQGDADRYIDEVTLERGKRCDLAIWSIEHPSELVCQLGMNPLHSRVWRGT